MNEIIPKTSLKDIQTILFERQEILELNFTQQYRHYFKCCGSDRKIGAFYVKCPCQLGCNFNIQNKPTIKIDFCYYSEEMYFFASNQMKQINYSVNKNKSDDTHKHRYFKISSHKDITKNSEFGVCKTIKKKIVIKDIPIILYIHDLVLRAGLVSDKSIFDNILAGEYISNTMKSLVMEWIEALRHANDCFDNNNDNELNDVLDISFNVQEITPMKYMESVLEFISKRESLNSLRREILNASFSDECNIE